MSIIKFPIICFYEKESFFQIVNSDDELTTTTSSGLKNQLFKNLTIIDSLGYVFKIKNAKKLNGVGILWGYNIFLNQKIKIELFFENNVTQISLVDLQKRIIKLLKDDKEFWESGGNYHTLLKTVSHQSSIYDLIFELGKIVNMKY